jgi:hydrogenase maturation protein HypF
MSLFNVDADVDAAMECATSPAHPHERGDDLARLRVTIRGAVQGVGFRPFVWRLAGELALAGWVRNTSQGVLIEAEGSLDDLRRFVARLDKERPPRAYVTGLEHVILDPVGYATFEIRESVETEKTAFVLPDIATCPECLREIADPADRRYRYPFTNCTHCGPRFSILEALPYDRVNTTMSTFELCAECRAEYENPTDRRFHAQPNACARCGPHLELWDHEGKVIEVHDAALCRTADLLRQGRIVAVKGLGGFHLMVDARDGDAVQRLRRLKRREEKPFALMYPSLRLVKTHCHVSELEERALISPESPIVLLQRFGPDTECDIAPGVAPRNPYLGIMLPYTPLHRLLMDELGFPLVATSGNLSEEPMCTHEREALDRLGGIADWFLVHNRPIARHVDDSIVCVVLDRELMLRRARGYAPLPVTLRQGVPPLLAVGAHLKSAVATAVGSHVFISQHIGDLETVQAVRAFHEVVERFGQIHNLHPAAVACDAHPDYYATHFAAALGPPVVRVQHHHAHILSCMADNDLAGPVLGVSWDGTGYGTDGTVWGGEFLHVDDGRFARVAHLRTFRLPGGETAIREPWRTAIGLLFEIFGEAVFDRDDLAPVRQLSQADRHILRTLLLGCINAPVTSSAGRLFDAIASILDVRHCTRFEGQAAMELEFTIPATPPSESYGFTIATDAQPGADGSFAIDWEPMVHGILDEAASGAEAGAISARFHNTLAEMIVTVAERTGIERVALSGGCFQNRYLLDRAVTRLRAAGFRPYWHQRVPPNDGGIALGQICFAAKALERKDQPCV